MMLQIHTTQMLGAVLQKTEVAFRWRTAVNVPVYFVWEVFAGLYLLQQPLLQH